MRLGQLVVEVTRRCNTYCAHCLRGDSQKMDINSVTIDKMLEGVEYIDTITFTGGEPTLAVNRIRYIADRIMQRNIGLGNFYVITNGIEASIDLVKVLIDLYAYADSNEVSGLCISGDQYHSEVIDNTLDAKRLYSALSFFHPKDRAYPISNHALIAEGRAKGWGGRQALLNTLSLGLDDQGKIEAIDGDVYVNVKGDVVPSCDLSYETQDEEKIGNVHQDTLEQILTRKYEMETA